MVCIFSSVVVFVLLDKNAAATGEDFRKNAKLAGWEEDRKARSDEMVDLTFALKETHLTKLKKIADRVSDPKSSDYGHYLSKKQIDELTAPRPKDIDVVEDYLRGIQFKKTAKGAWISAKANVTVAQHLVGGTFVYFCNAAKDRSRTCVLRNPTAQVPAALSKACDVISPLSDPLPDMNAPPLPGPIEHHGPSLQYSSVELDSKTSKTLHNTTQWQLEPPLEPGPVILPDCCSSIPCPPVLGRATEFNATGCPHNAENLMAAKRIHAKRGSSGEKPHSSYLVQRGIAAASENLAAEPATAGCCFSIGYGAMMKPCCLEVTPANTASDCMSDHPVLGGATQFNGTSCPRNADEAAEWIHEKRDSIGEELHSSNLVQQGMAVTLVTTSFLLLAVYSTGVHARHARRALHTPLLVAGQ